MAAYPNLVYSVRANRAFLTRAVRFLAAEQGVRQFLDIGTGIPTANNTHEVAQRVAPEARIVYVETTVASRVVHIRAEPVCLKRTRERKRSQRVPSRPSRTPSVSRHRPSPWRGGW